MEYIVDMENIQKYFPGVHALKGVQLKLRPGEVTALLGENGAGKSTLMKILSGVHNKDGGTILIDGESVETLTPKLAQQKGIAIIHQELNMCPDLTVAENMFLANEDVHAGFILSNKEMEKKAQEILDTLKVSIKADEIVGNLSVSKQQMVEIAKALSQNTKVLIMDEPTSALSASEIEELFTIINRLKADGCAIVYISHRLAELEHIVDRVVIMRDGEYIMSEKFTDMTMDEIVTNMVGRELTEQFPRVECEVGKPILEVENLNAGPLVRDISFTLREGEIIGISGLMGSGRTELTRALFGADPSTGVIKIDGKTVNIKKPIDAIQNGLVLAPEDRRKDGLCVKLSVRENLSLPNLDLISDKIGVLSKKKEESLVSKAISQLGIKLSSQETPASTLSGGNQQKVVVGKWLARNSRIVIFDEPTRGIDVGAKVEIYNLMNSLKEEGVGVLFVSSEMPEVLGIADKILVMSEGRITGEVDVQDADQKKLLELATKFENKLENMIEES